MVTTSGPTPNRLPLRVPLAEGREACAASVRAFTAACDDLDELALLGGSRCHGWSRLEVLVHVLDGWQELLGGLLARHGGPPTVDAASYWTAFAADVAGQDPVDRVLAVRRRAAAYARPASARRHLHDVAAALLRGVDGLGEEPLRFQGHVLAPGDLLATWAVEDAVHHLDLLVERPIPAPALALARSTVEALVGEALPADVGDARVVLAGTGRVAVPAALGRWAHRLPVLG